MKKYILAYIIVLATCLSACTQTNSSEPTTVPQKSEINFIEETQPVILKEKPDEIVPTYGYDNLSCETSKIVYNKIDEAVKNNTPFEFSCESYVSDSQLLEISEAYRSDHPEVFWFTGDFVYYTKDNITFIELEYNMTGKELDKAKTEFNSKLNEVVNQIPLYENEIDRELYIHNHIVDTCDYGYDNNLVFDDAIEKVNNTYSALVDGITVCEGFSKTFQMLCNKVGIECVCISGQAFGENHMWNAVKINGDWYNTDITGSDQNELTGFIEKKYDFFNISDELLYKKYLYIPAGYYTEDLTSVDLINFYVPECNITEYNYYNSKYAKISDFDNVDHIINDIANASRKKEEYFCLVVDESLDYENLPTQLRKEGHLSKWIDEANLINESYQNVDYGAIRKLENFNTLLIYLIYK